MNRDILTGSEAISAHYYTTMCIVQYSTVQYSTVQYSTSWAKLYGPAPILGYALRGALY